MARETDCRRSLGKKRCSWITLVLLLNVYASEQHGTLAATPTAPVLRSTAEKVRYNFSIVTSRVRDLCDAPCGPGMTCYDTRCVCIDQEDMIYNPITLSCLSFVDTACFLEPIVGVIKNCVENAFCQPLNPITGVCKCQEGFDGNEDRLCGDSTVGTTLPTSSRPTPSTIPTSSELPGTTNPPGVSYPAGFIGQSCNSQGERGCVEQALCVDNYCVCPTSNVPTENFQGCRSSATLLGWRNNCLLLFTLGALLIKI